MNLDKFDLSRWEKDILNEFNIDDCLNCLLCFVNEEGKEDFLINLADGLFSYKKSMV